MQDSERSVFIGGTAPLNGLVGHTALWDIVLGEDEITQIFALGHSIDLRMDLGDYQSSGNLKHYWRPGEDSMAIGRDFAAVDGIDIGVNAANLTFDEDIVLEGP